MLPSEVPLNPSLMHLIRDEMVLVQKIPQPPNLQGKVPIADYPSFFFFIPYQYVFHILEVAVALTHDLFMTISFPQGEGPHVQPPTALLRY